MQNVELWALISGTLCDQRERSVLFALERARHGEALDPEGIEGRLRWQAMLTRVRNGSQESDLFVHARLRLRSEEARQIGGR
ncbi:hypothetical protein D3C83_181650 [compost metagenome]